MPRRGKSNKDYPYFGEKGLLVSRLVHRKGGRIYVSEEAVKKNSVGTEKKAEMWTDRAGEGGT